MKHLHYLLCLGLLSAFISCSKEEEEEVPTPPSNEQGQEVGNDSNQPPVTYIYYGAELYSKETFKYGRFEAKMKMAYAPGCISSMFLYYNDSYQGGGKVWNEIDIEVIGKNPNGFQSNIITGWAEGQITTEKFLNLPSSVDSEYHVYAIDWTPDYVLWTVDGVEVRKTETSNDPKKQVEALVEEQSLRFNLWASKSVAWVGQLDQKNIPIAQYIDYVKVYDYDAESKSFTEKWTDEFDTFDKNRWSKGTWEMELVRLRASNIEIEDGALVLKLTKEEIQAVN